MQLRENKEIDTRTPYKKMQDELTRLAELYKIKLDRGHFFEDMILKLAEVKERPTNSQFAESTKFHGEFVNIDFEFSKETCSQLVKSLNSQFPDLMAEDGTEEYESRLGGNRRNRITFYGPPARFIRIRAAAITKHLLPLFAEYLKTNPEAALPYIKFNFNELIHKVDTELVKYGISCSKTDCFEETICALVNRYFNTSARASHFFQTVYPGDAKPFSDDPLNITLSYLGVKPIKPREDDINLLTTTSQFQPHPPNKWMTDLYITTDIDQAKKIEAYFNRLQQGGAKLSPEKELLENKKLHLTKITINNSVLMNDKFWIHFNDAMQSYSKEKILAYRKQAHSINRTIDECLEELKEIHKIIILLDQDKSLLPAQQLLATKIRMYFVDLELQIRAEECKDTEFNPIITGKMLSPELTACIGNLETHLQLLKNEHSSHPVISEFFTKNSANINKLIDDVSDLATNKLHLPPIRKVEERRRLEFDDIGLHGGFIARC